MEKDARGSRQQCYVMFNQYVLLFEWSTETVDTVNTELALLFEAALGLDPEMLLNMQTRYNMQVARADQRTQDRWNEVRKLCASFL